MLNDNLLSQSYNQIVQGALGGQFGSRFQMFGAPQSWTWPTPPTGQQSAQAYQATSVMPAWSPVGSYGVLDADFFSAYKSALSHVAFQVSPQIQLAVTNLRNKATQDSNAATAAASNMNAAYLAASQNGGLVFAAMYPTINAWITGPGQKYKTAYEQALAVYGQDNQTLLTMQQASMPSTLQDAINVTATPTGNPANDPAPPGWTKVPDGSGILRWEPDWTIGTTGTDWRAELTTGSVGAFDIKLDASNSTVDFSKSWASASTSYGGDWFWSVYAEGSWSQMNLTTSDNKVTAEIHVKSSTLVPVTPGLWYDGGFMRDLALGSPQSGGWSIVPPWVATGGKASLFGPNGLLATRVSGLLAVYQPSFSVTMASSTFKENQSQIEASGGFKIGGFSIGGEGGTESDYQVSTSGGTTFTAESTSTDPVLIGVTVAFPGVDEQSAS